MTYFFNRIDDDIFRNPLGSLPDGLDGGQAGNGSEDLPIIEYVARDSLRF